MKRALVLTIASFGWTVAAFAQAPNTGVTPGPHNPNPPMNAPDLRLPAPCAPASTLAATGGVLSPVEARARALPSAQVTPIETAGGTQCSANTITQSAELPGLASGVQ
ncbi:MAG TPA: hypothetical protein VG328_04520 [Stellaceae bacterium]|nr:hypothetical protein [Stellaceae bacterium]